MMILPRNCFYCGAVATHYQGSRYLCKKCVKKYGPQAIETKPYLDRFFDNLDCDDKEYREYCLYILLKIFIKKFTHTKVTSKDIKDAEKYKLTISHKYGHDDIFLDIDEDV